MLSYRFLHFLADWLLIFLLFGVSGRGLHKHLEIKVSSIFEIYRLHGLIPDTPMPDTLMSEQWTDFTDHRDAPCFVLET